MTFGHHGVFSLTPIFLFSIVGALRLLDPRSRLSGASAWLTMLLTVAMLAFYTWNPKARNYGGSTQGLRWLFWLIPFWLVLLPAGVEGGQDAAGSAGFRWRPCWSRSSRSATPCARPGAIPGSSTRWSI